MENYKFLSESVKSVYESPKIIFKPFRACGFAEIVKTLGVMMDLSSEISVFCDERTPFHDDYYEKMAGEIGECAAQEIKGEMRRRLVDFSNRENSCLNLIIKTYTRGFFDGLLFRREDFKKAGRVRSFSDLNSFKERAVTMDSFAFTADGRILIQRSNKGAPYARGCVYSDSALSAFGRSLSLAGIFERLILKSEPLEPSAYMLAEKPAVCRGPEVSPSLPYCFF